LNQLRAKPEMWNVSEKLNSGLLLEQGMICEGINPRCYHLSGLHDSWKHLGIYRLLWNWLPCATRCIEDQNGLYQIY